MGLSRKSVALVLLSLALPAIASAQVRSSASLARLRDSAAAIGGRVIVTLKSSSGQTFLRAPGSPPISDDELDQIQSRLQSRHARLQLHGHLRLIGGMMAQADDATLTELNNDPDVAAIEADTPSYLTDVHDGPPMAADALAFSQTVPWGITQVTAPAAWAAGYRGDGVKVGMMDSGGDPTHPDLAWAGGYNAVTGGTTSADWADNIGSCDGHGTHVAGTVAALDNGVGVVGVAPDVTLYALKVFQDISGSCGAFTSSQILALQWAVTNHIRIVSASIGGGSSAAYSAAVDQAAAAGTYLIAAAGNDNGGAVEYPGAYPSAIAVSSLSTANTVSSFSSVGPQVFLGAPGENVESTLPGGTYGTKSGTSMATPHVAGVAALLLQQNPNLSLAQLRQELQSGALDLAAAGFDNGTGWGLVRAYNSLTGTSTTPVTLAIAPAGRSTSVVQGGTAAGANAVLTFSGTNAASTTWTATKKASWLTLTTASGTGSGTLAWSHTVGALAAGTYVDTIAVTAAGVTGTSAIFDTLKVTAPVVPVTLAVSPAARAISVQQGNSAAGDNAAVTLAGTNAASTTWSATKKATWLTLTTASGTGSGTLAWSRNAATLGVGTYVDTITISAAGVTGSKTVFDTLKITAAPIPVTLAIGVTARSVSVQQGSTAPGDNAPVTLAGTNAATTTWSATKKAAWLTLTTASGTGSGTVAWTRNAASLAVGTYVDTIAVSAVGVTGSKLVFDTLKITAAPVPVTLAVSPAARSISVQQGSSAAGDNAAVTLAGTNAASTTWSATKKAAWLTLTTASGTGSGTLAWGRSAGSLAVGTYVDTITVSAAGVTGSKTVFDTLKITAAPIPVTLAVGVTARSVSVQQGSSAPGDNAPVTLAGTNAASTTWSATKKAAWLTLTTASGTGSGTLAWTRSAASLAVGTYVDTITVSAAGVTGSKTVFDTLKITAAPIPVTLAVAPAARSISVQQGNSAAGDNATVTLAGTNAASTTWSATKKAAWLTLTTASGTGSGTLAWTRSAASLAVGTYVDTITVSAAGVTGSKTVFDTLKITAAPIPVTLAVAPAARSISVQQGNTAPSDNATVTLAGTSATSTTWSATKKASWLTLTTASGTGSGTIAWSRNASGLAVGSYVDTITVTAAGVSGSKTLFDTLKITAPPIPVTVALAPQGRSATVQLGGTAPGDNAAVTLAGTGAASTSWVASTRHSWISLATGSGTGSGTVTWTRNASGLAAGTYVDTMTVVAAGASATLYDTLHVTTPIVPVTVALAPSARSVAAQQGTTILTDNASITLSGTAATTTAWTATARHSYTTLTAAGGTGNGQLSWSRNTTGLAVGTYVDTITVSAASATASLFDTLRITAAPPPIVPVTVAVSPASRSVTMQQGSNAAADFATVTLSGTSAASTTWSATSRHNWTVLTTSSGTGDGNVSWNRNVSSLGAGIWVDTITVVAGTSAATIYDSVQVTALVPVVVAIDPGSRHTSVVQGSAAAVASARVTLTGTNAATTRWTATNRQSWNTLFSATGTGSGTVVWSRNPGVRVAGTYIDTITVSVASGATALLIDSLQVVGPTHATISLAPGGRRSRMLTVAGVASVMAISADSATVTSDSSIAGDSWQATTTAPRLQLTRTEGQINTDLVWQRLATNLSIGMHVDTLTVQLVQDSSVKALFVDSLEVVSVDTPEPTVAVEELFHAGNLSTDQRTLLDKLGNNNGNYDIGDLLAWMDRTHAHLSANVVARLQQLMMKPAVTAVADGRTPAKAPTPR